MIFSQAKDRLFAGGALLSFSLLFVVQGAIAQAVPQALTPFGYRDRAKVHRVPEGYELISMPDTHIRMHNPTTGDVIDFPKPVIPLKRTTPLPDDGWITYASWYVVGDQAYYAGLYDVTPGTFLAGQIRLLGHKRNNFSYSADFYGYSGTTLKVTRIPQLVWATETLEVYGVNDCSEFPNTSYTEMSAIQMYFEKDPVPPVNWLINDVTFDCGVQTTITVDGANQGIVDIYY